MSGIRKHFASDNYSGICPEVMEYIIKANRDHEVSYGDDPYTAEAIKTIRELFETDCPVFFVFNGTAANALALSSLCNPFHGIICHENAHIETDECAAPQFFTHGAKLLLTHGNNGKVSPAAINDIVSARDDVHSPKPRAVSITQATELGTVYSLDELEALCEAAKKHSLLLHMDGARFANALATLKTTPRRITVDYGVDVLCLGGTKLGSAVGEAVVFFNKQYAEEFGRRCKQAAQLASKMRIISASWLGLLKTGAWLKNATHANRCAEILEKRLRQEAPGIKIVFPREANSLFVQLPEKAIQSLHDKGWHFYTFIGRDIVRFMCSWDTKEEEIERFVGDVKRVLNEKRQ